MINVFSPFDGMSCAQQALERAGVPVRVYIASEIDKYAVKVTQANYPNTQQWGSITNIRGWMLPRIDLMIGGSPCQGFSSAGKHLNFSDPRSVLFFEYVRLLNEIRAINPDVKFVLENVRMKQEYQDVISHYLGVKPICINSALVSAQNRVRYYWTNIEGIEQPADREIYLQDIIIDGEVDRDKSLCIDANYYKGGSLKNYLTKKRRQHKLSQSENRLMVRGATIQSRHINANGAYSKNIEDPITRILEIRKDGKSNPITTTNSRSIVVRGAAIRGRHLDQNGIRDDRPEIPITQQLEVRTDEKSNALTTVQKDNVLCIRVGTAVGIKGYDHQKRVYSVDGKSPSHTAKGHIAKIAVDEQHWRKLYVVECERLQTVPDGYTDHVSNTQRYKMLGNGMTVDVIAHILQGLA